MGVDKARQGRYMAEYRSKPQNKARRKAIDQTLLGRCRLRLANSKSIAKRKGFMPCLISAEDLAKTKTEYCEICTRLESELGKPLAMDHCHKTGKFRGWLCNVCNIEVGFYETRKTRIEEYVSTRS